MAKLVTKSRWKKIKLSDAQFDDHFEDLVYLEELKDYDIITDNVIVEHDTYIQKKAKSSKKPHKPTITQQISTDACTEHDFSEIGVWRKKKLNVPIEICKSLLELGFFNPTKIQEAIIPLVINQKNNIIASAETGSGKTLAFAIPIVSQLIQEHKQYSTILDLNKFETSTNIRSLILTPTRELALQIKAHITSIIKYTDIKVITLVGGMSMQKQERLLNQNPHIIVATPGRLRDLLSGGGANISLNFDPFKVLNFSNLTSIVLDEADRMITAGHWQDLKFILSHISTLWHRQKLSPTCQAYVISATMTLPLPNKKAKLTSKSTSKRHKSGKDGSKGVSVVNKIKRLFASLPFVLRNNVSTDTGETVRKVKGDCDFKVIDLAPASLTVSTLEELQVKCLHPEDKDLNLYYFLSSPQHNSAGRTLVFANSIDCVRRLTSLLKLLLPKHAILQLHASMAQKNRLKTLDTFKNYEPSKSQAQSIIMVSSDLTARGLDIIKLDRVVHYELPNTFELFIHRSGRTARAGLTGLSLALVSPLEVAKFRDYCKRRGKSPEDIPLLDVSLPMREALRARLALASDLETLLHQSKRQRNTTTWERRVKEAFELESDDNGDLDTNDLNDDMGNHPNDQKLQKTIAQMKKDLANLLNVDLCHSQNKKSLLRKTVI